MNEEILFKEKQRMRQWWIRIPLLFLLTFMFYAVIKQIIFDIPVGEKPAPNWLLLMIFVIIFTFCVLLYMLTLNTSITKTGIEIRFLPFVNKMIPWQDINSAEVLKYSFVGYGMRLSLKYGTVYNISGNMGLLLITNRGKILLGTQKAAELDKIVKDIFIRK